MVSKTAIPFLNPHPRPSGSKGLHRAAGVVSPAPDAVNGEEKPLARPQPRQRQKTQKPEGTLKKKRQSQSDSETAAGGRRAAASSASAQRRAAHKADLERRVLDAARQLFGTQGAEAVTLREVAAAVGYSHATIYSFFSDKAALLARLAAESQEELSALLAAALVPVPQQSDSDAAALGRLVRAYLRWAATHPHHYRLMMLACSEAPPAVFEQLAVLLGSRASAERTLQTQTLWAALHGAALLEIVQVPAGGLDWAPLEARADALIRLLQRGLAPESLRGSRP